MTLKSDNFYQIQYHDAKIFEPLKKTIQNILIPAICGKVVSDIERKLISLPYKYRGLGIRNPVETCKDQFDQSLAITSELTQMIC